MAVQSFERMPVVMRRRAGNVDKNVTRIARRAAGVIDREVVVTTPVDKGVARSNWVGTLDAPFNGVIPAYAPGSKLGLGERANAAAAIAQASVAIQRFDSRRNHSILITNNVPYMVLLNSGTHSSQAAASFIQAAVQRGAAVVRNEEVLKD